jgi:tetratricopeptide (TPR) repeat protein
MKSEHRHELKTNDLAKSLLTFQDYAKEYGGRVILGVLIVILGIFLIVQRMGSSRSQAAKSQDDLAYARTMIDRLGHATVGPDGRVSVRPAEVENVREVLSRVRDKASDKNVLAAATVAQGDYCWAMANYPDVPAAATQPSLRPEKDRGELLKEAQAAYQQALTEYPDQTISAIAAHFGLAAISENLRNWDEAKRHYEAVKAMSTADDEFKAYADDKLKRLEAMRQPMLVGLVAEKIELPKPLTPPSTAPATSMPADTTPIKLPTTKPSSPTTKPSK